MMTDVVRGENLEVSIIEAARSLFIEKGFAETSMSDIAAKVGINRPGLHYYFRTKDKMFQAVFGMILRSFISKVQDAVQQRDKSISERIEMIIDIYYNTIFHENPCLPLFILREINRDVDYFLNSVKDFSEKEFLNSVITSLQEEMKQGKIKPVPLRIVFFTFYSLLAFPFLTKNLNSAIFMDKGECFEDILAEWKPYIISQMENLLCVDK